MGDDRVVSRYGQYCPITRSLEILGDRWTLLIVRDLLVGAPRFNELARGLPGMSRAILSKRLDQLERARPGRAHATTATEPTPACEELRPIIFGLAEWGARWAFGEPRTDELDPTVLMWWIRGGIDPAPFGDRRVVLHVQLPDGRRTRFWFVDRPARRLAVLHRPRPRGRPHCSSRRSARSTRCGRALRAARPRPATA